MNITIVNTKKRKIPRLKVKKVIKKTLEEFSVDKDLSICFVGDKKIQEYNKKFLKKNSSTDVLAFSEEEDGTYLGDVIISVDTAKKNAKVYGTEFTQELLFYVVHGVLHLLGFDDSSLNKRKKMLDLQTKILKKCRF